MSLWPYFLDLDPRPRQLLDFARALTSDDLLAMLNQPMDYYRRWRQFSEVFRDASSTIKTDRNKFEVNVDVQHFAPDEIVVKTSDGYVVIEGKHEEKKDEHGWVSRRFARRYPLPESCSADAVQSRLSSDGVLTITAPLVSPQGSDVRVVPIVHTGPVRTQPEGAKYQIGDGGAAAPLENGQ